MPVASFFAYNDRSEVLSAAIGTNLFTHAYDDIGNHLLFGDNAATNTFTHNQLNQIVGRAAPSAPPISFSYTPDGGLASNGTWSYAYDAEDQLTSVTSSSLTNGAIRVLNTYDYRRRRTSKTVQRLYSTIAPPPSPPVGVEEWQTLETRTFVYDDWNLIHETIYTIDGSTTNTTEVQYFWGLDLSDSLKGAGGVGGLLAVSRNGQFYFPTYDNNGNVTKYIDESCNIAAAYEYDDFGRIISQSGPLANFFHHRFSTKYFDSETGLYYYGFRFSHPILMLWLNRDPLEEEGGINLYLRCNNNPYNYDVLGLWSATGESYGDTRRVYKKDDGDTIKGLAKKIEMDESTFNLWARVETKSKISSPNGGIPAPNSDAGLKNVCYISVPNVWIEADLLRGGGVFARFVNLGGTIGSFFGQTLGRWGYYTCQPTTPVDLQNTVMMNYQNLYGLTVYAHGSTDGRIGNPQGEQIHQKNLINIIRGNRYRIAKANMMQCYSLIPNGTICLGPNREIPFNYKEAWNKTAVKVYGYEGINILLINYNKKK